MSTLFLPTFRMWLGWTFDLVLAAALFSVLYFSSPAYAGAVAPVLTINDDQPNDGPITWISTDPSLINARRIGTEAERIAISAVAPSPGAKIVKWTWFTPSGTTLDGGLHMYVGERPGSEELSDSFARTGGGTKGDTFFTLDFSSADGRTCPSTGCDIFETSGITAAFDVEWSDGSFYLTEFTSDVETFAPEPPGLLLLSSGVLGIGGALRRYLARRH